MNHIRFFLVNLVKLIIENDNFWTTSSKRFAFRFFIRVKRVYVKNKNILDDLVK